MQQTLTSLMDFDESLRVVAPDIGGGFGPKLCVLFGGVAIVAATPLLKRSLKWIEDRREYFTNAVHERNDGIEIAVDAHAKILGVRGKLLHDMKLLTIGSRISFIPPDHERPLCRAEFAGRGD